MRWESSARYPSLVANGAHGVDRFWSVQFTQGCLSVSWARQEHRDSLQIAEFDSRFGQMVEVVLTEFSFSCGDFRSRRAAQATLL